MSDNKNGIGIVGAGMIARTHAEALRQIPGARLVAICSHNASSAKQFAEEYACNWYSDLSTMLQNPDIQIVALCTPSGLHGVQAIMCAEAGKHVLTEKPMGIDTNQIREMIAACHSHQVKLAVISQHRFQPDVIRAKQCIDEGRLGTIIAANASINWYRTQDYYDSATWRGTWKWDGGGALMNQGIHTVDVLQYLAGPVHSVYAQCRTVAHKRIEVEDVAAATLQYKHGGVGTLFASTSCYPGLQSRIELFGQRGSLILENNCITNLHYMDQDDTDDYSAQKASNLVSSNPALAVGDTHLVQYIDFIDAIAHDRAPSVSGEEGAKPLSIILAAYQSAELGIPVVIEDLG
ncbi:Gfo/Idh/MocA family protein [Paenibacillus qinlingensis]|uniref:Gfo/Idh/MocA family protein n=1 Tax=Paenibacillus qinlingensis TaxID=1837343 RepID=UPI0015661F79|nr:Gfo/Idh/MocA family oxidoreductase [Paenibacillus qinlingensis]NQX60744.1 Gfo/Idh/MocA family oxidoreductase [Paenibacillus qinlingensis]